MGFVMTLLALSCQHTDIARSKPEALALPSVSADEIIGRCSPWLLDHVDNEENTQHNELVNLIIDRAWDLDASPEGIFYHIINPGIGKKAVWGDKVLVEYTGYDSSGKIFDSSFYRKNPFKSYVGNVIEGWYVALSLLGENGSGYFLIPANKAYGKEGFGTMVGPDQHLIFKIELLEILP
jgi:FKBP-type peptidyl-prolyl cis-trans isomerase